MTFLEVRRASASARLCPIIVIAMVEMQARNA
jgi:hypothetical protein